MRFRHALASSLALIVVTALLLPCGVALSAPASSGAPVAKRHRHGGPNLLLAAAPPNGPAPVDSVLPTVGTPASAASSAASTDASASSEVSLSLAGQAIVAMTWKAERTGSGIVIAPNRVLTSTRVLHKDDPTVRIMTVDGEQYSFKVVAKDDQLGLALLEPDRLLTVKPFLGWTDANKLIAGDPVYALGIQSTARSLLEMPGKVSSPSAATGGSLILTDIKLDPLVEGGALAMPDGKVAGIVTAKSHNREVGELGWAVTSEAAREFLGGIDAVQKAKEAEALTTIIRRWVVRLVLLAFLGVFALFGWWFRRWYKRMEQREAAAAAAEAGDGALG